MPASGIAFKGVDDIASAADDSPGIAESGSEDTDVALGRGEDKTTGTSARTGSDPAALGKGSGCTGASDAGTAADLLDRDWASRSGFCITGGFTRSKLLPSAATPLLVLGSEDLKFASTLGNFPGEFVFDAGDWKNDAAGVGFSVAAGVELALSMSGSVVIDRRASKPPNQVTENAPATLARRIETNNLIQHEGMVYRQARIELRQTRQALQCTRQDYSWSVPARCSRCNSSRSRCSRRSCVRR